MRIYRCVEFITVVNKNITKNKNIIQNVNFASRLSKFWNFFGTIQMISCRDWWPWTKPSYLTTTRRQSNNQKSGGIAAHPHPKKIPSAKIRWKMLASIFWYQDGILLIVYLPKDQTINAEYYSSLLVQFKDILKGKRRGKFTKVVLFLHKNAPAHRTLGTQNKLAYHELQHLDHPPYSPDLAPSDYHLFPGLKNNWKVAIFLTTRRSLVPRRPGCTDNILNCVWVICKS
jgi:transposase